MAKNKKTGKKVSCSVCKAQYNKFCTLKRVSVSLNKKRLCDKYVFDESKVKEGVPIPTVRIGYEEKQRIKKEEKEQLKKLKAMGLDKEASVSVPPKADPESRIWKPHGNEKYPLTGDLSRFTTTGSADKEERDRQRKKI